MQRQLPRHFIRGLIKAGESIAGIGRLELSEDVMIALVERVEDAGAVSLPHLALVTHLEFGITRRNSRIELKAQKIRFCQ